MRRLFGTLVLGATFALVSGCGGAPSDASAGAATPPAAPAAGAVASTEVSAGEATYKKACVLCHQNGDGGAPKIGDKESWAPRIAQGMATLHEHSIKGYTGKTGAMPPKGGNLGLADADVMAAVDYMVSRAQ